MATKQIDLGPFVEERIAEWAYWITAREEIRKNRLKDPQQKKPWTNDPVMAGTRWCNVRRMDDKVSIWLMENWYSEFDQEFPDYRNFMSAALLARMVNRPETLAEITGGKRFTKFDYDKALKAMYAVKDRGEPVFTGAYIINGASGGPKIEQVLNAVRRCHETKPFTFIDTSSMQRTAESLYRLPGIGGFMSGQVVADLRWVMNVPGYWQDRMDWAPPGPGSSRGMKYLLGMAGASDMAGRGKDLTPRQFLIYLPKLISIAKVYPGVAEVFRERKLEAHDIQNTLCETSKYIRVKNGGRGKNAYPPR